METILQGYLIKSPPEKKTQGTFKLFSAKWRRRYFVLYAPPTVEDIPDAYTAILEYYTNKRQHTKCGSINLAECEEVMSSLDSDVYKFVFGLQTKHKSHDRTYYLVAETEKEMNKWVNTLIRVLGLAENDNCQPPPPSFVEARGGGSRIAGSRMDAVKQSMMRPRPNFSTHPGVKPSSPEAGVQVRSTIMPFSHLNVSEPNLLDCSSHSSRSTISMGSPPQRIGMRNANSVPELDQVGSGFQPEPPPRNLDMASPREKREFMKLPPKPGEIEGDMADGQGRGGSHCRQNVPVSGLTTYDQPKLNYLKEVQGANTSHKYIVNKNCVTVNETDECYDVPPNLAAATANDCYDRPPMSATQHGTGKDGHGKKFAPAKLEETYDMPPRHAGGASEDMYDMPPRHGGGTIEDMYDMPPRHGGGATEDMYDMPPKHGGGVTEDMYDMPPKHGGGATEDMYDMPPKHAGGMANDMYEMPSRHTSSTEDTYDTPPKHVIVTEDVYDLPPKHAQGKTPKSATGRNEQSVVGVGRSDGTTTGQADDIYDRPLVTTKPTPAKRHSLSKPKPQKLVPKLQGAENSLSDQTYDIPPTLLDPPPPKPTRRPTPRTSLTSKTLTPQDTDVNHPVYDNMASQPAKTGHSEVQGVTNVSVLVSETQDLKIKPPSAFKQNDAASTPPAYLIKKQSVTGVVLATGDSIRFTQRSKSFKRNPSSQQSMRCAIQMPVKRLVERNDDSSSSDDIDDQ